MVYCELCGAANDIMNQQCHRCGHSFVPVEAGSGEAVQPVLAQAGAQAVPAGSELESAASIGAGLELPEWLQRAAASTPEIPAAQKSNANGSTPSQFPVFEAIVQPHETIAPPANQRTQTVHNLQETHHSADTMQPGASYPGGSSTMPEWLKTGRPPIVPPVLPDATDTSSFIGESDLPEWIRQIGAADTAKRNEEERIAAELARANEEPAPARTLLPGEGAANGPASNPWLSRKEQSGVSSAWVAGTPAAKSSAGSSEQAVDDDARPEVIQVDPALIPPAAKSKVKRSMPSVKIPSVSKPTIPRISMNLPSNDSSSPLLRYVLIGAIAVLVVLLLFLVVL